MKAHHGLEVGKYKAMIDIFQHIDQRAVSKIHRNSARIKRLLKQPKAPESTYIPRIFFLIKRS